MRDELQTVLIAARELPAPELPRLLGELEEIRATAMARLAAPAIVQQRPDELLTVEQAAERLGMSKDYLYRHSELPFVRRIGTALRFSANGISEYISRKGRK